MFVYVFIYFSPVRFFSFFLFSFFFFLFFYVCTDIHSPISIFTLNSLFGRGRWWEGEGEGEGERTEEKRREKEKEEREREGGGGHTGWVFIFICWCIYAPHVPSPFTTPSFLPFSPSLPYLFIYLFTLFIYSIHNNLFFFNFFTFTFLTFNLI